ncbi:YCF48-related protein [[Flexibacter] sp. ATCC 35103]|uniref:T9SS type A sorting domain-containing protein n=1 Tax=[Flexibacter] sp. ATCC 35103 TaxID=1937528 RepID=UPI0009D22030|nr:YCF48-related protein [[Flexibacter] sp. ATCC 35103]OMQ11572.1 hypothetical protein BXU01_08485 [[Flexibacter] sp. ATCC 35103]
MKKKLLLVLSLIVLQNSHAQWTKITSPYAGNLWAIKFFDAQNGYIGGNTAILKTTDGGVTWTSKSISNFLISSFSFPSATVGYYGCNNNIVAKTTDAGLTWTNQNPNASPYAILSVSFPTVNTGYAVGDAGTIRKTTDGGTTWATQASGLTTGIEEVHFFDVNTGICVGDGGKIKRTTNGGATWVTIASGTTENLYDIFFLNANTGFIAGGTGTILKTTNGGQTWSALNTGFTDWLTCICFKDASTGYAGGTQGKMFKTIDGGATWTPEVSGVSFAKAINDIIYINNRFIAVTNQGEIITDVPTLGTAENIKEDAVVMVYPNPTSDSFSVDYHNNENLTLKINIIDVNGVIVKSKVLNENQRTVNVKDLSNGVYIVEIKAGRFSATKKLIIKK